MLMEIRYSIKVEPTQCQNDDVFTFKRRFKLLQSDLPEKVDMSFGYCMRSFVCTTMYERAFWPKIVSMIRKYHNHKPQTNTRHREEESHNNHETLGKQTKQSNQLSFPHQADCKNKMDIKKL